MAKQNHNSKEISEEEAKQLVDEMEKRARPKGIHLENLKLLHDRHISTALSMSQLSMAWTVVALTFVLAGQYVFLNETLWLKWTRDNIFIVVFWSLLVGFFAIFAYHKFKQKASWRSSLVIIFLSGIIIFSEILLFLNINVIRPLVSIPI